MVKNVEWFRSVSGRIIRVLFFIVNCSIDQVNVKTMVIAILIKGNNV